jgi:hypothetical protein
MESWNLAAQFEVPGSLAITFGYMGSRGIHLLAPNYNLNVPDVEVWNQHLAAGEDPTATVPDPYGRTNAQGQLINVRQSDLWRPYPTVGNITYTGKANQLSWYNATYVQADRRFSAGLSFRVNYTWAKSIDTGTNANDLGLCNSCKVQYMDDMKMNRSVSEFDQRHRINLIGSWEVPFGRGKALLGNSNRVVSAIVSGWVLNSNSSITGGLPWQVFLTQGGLNNGLPGFGGPLRAFPDVLQGVPLKNPAWNRTVANNVPYLNPAAFSFPQYGKYGTGPRTLDYFRTPWRPVFNASIFREIRPFEAKRRYFQLRGEIFNVINHT